MRDASVTTQNLKKETLNCLEDAAVLQPDEETRISVQRHLAKDDVRSSGLTFIGDLMDEITQDMNFVSQQSEEWRRELCRQVGIRELLAQDRKRLL